jgi:hypothetical protein
MATSSGNAASVRSSASPLLSASHSGTREVRSVATVRAEGATGMRA